MDQKKTNIESIQVIEERLRVDREIVETGKVHVHKTVKQETVSVNIPVVNESYDVERREGSNEIFDSPPAAIRHEGEKIIIPVLKEITVVQKKYQVVEEIHLTRKITETPLTQEVTLRKEEVTVDRESL